MNTRSMVSLRSLVAAAAVTQLPPWQPAVVHGEVIAPPLARAEDRARFRVSVFATGLAFPTSMAQLADGSLLVATKLALAPSSFPGDLAGGVFVPFSGLFNQGGVNNDENPLVFVNTADNTYYHFIENQIMGHPNGLLSTSEGLYLSDLNYLGFFGNFRNSNPDVPADQQGVIYLITYVPEPSTIVGLLVGLACLATRLRIRAKRTAS